MRPFDIPEPPPIPILDRSLTSAVVLTPDAIAFAAGRMVGVNCTVAGNLTLTMADGTTFTWPVSVGFQTQPFSITAYSVPGSGGATATVTNFY